VCLCDVVGVYAMFNSKQRRSSNEDEGEKVMAQSSYNNKLKERFGMKQHELEQVCARLLLVDRTRNKDVEANLEESRKVQQVTQ
jgi:hypothetical protein